MLHRGDRRWFMFTAASAVAGLGTYGWAARDLAAEPARMIWNQNTDNPGAQGPPTDKPADCWFFAAQSNTFGAAMLKAPLAPDPHILFFNRDNRWVIAEEPMAPPAG